MKQKNITQCIGPEDIVSDLGVSRSDANKIIRDLNHKFRQYNPNTIIIPGKVYKIWYEQNLFKGETATPVNSAESPNNTDMLASYEDILNPQDLQSILRLSRNTIYKCLSDGTIPSIRIADKYLIPKRNLIEFLSNSSLSNKDVNIEDIIASNTHTSSRDSAAFSGKEN